MKISITFPQLMYSIATSRKKIYTYSPISYIDTKFGSAKNQKKTTDFGDECSNKVVISGIVREKIGCGRNVKIFDRPCTPNFPRNFD